MVAFSKDCSIEPEIGLFQMRHRIDAHGNAGDGRWSMFAGRSNRCYARHTDSKNYFKKDKPRNVYTFSCTSKSYTLHQLCSLLAFWRSSTSSSSISHCRKLNRCILERYGYFMLLNQYNVCKCTRRLPVVYQMGASLYSEKYLGDGDDDDSFQV